MRNFQSKMKITAFAAHNIEIGEDVLIDFHSNDYTAIPENILFDVMKQYRGCGCFFIELVISGEANKMITAEVHSLTFHVIVYFQFQK